MSNSPYTSAFNLVGGEQIAGMAVVDAGYAEPIEMAGGGVRKKSHRKKSHRKKSHRKKSHRKKSHRKKSHRKKSQRKKSQRKKSQRKYQKRNRIMSGGAPPVELKEVPNSGVPRTKPDDMIFQCMWISILDYYDATGEKIIDNNGNEVTTVQALKDYAECGGNCNGKNKYTEVLPGVYTIDGEEIVIHNQKSREALQRLAGKLDKTIRIFNRHPTDKLDINGLTVDNGKSPVRDEFYGQYELSGTDGYKEEVKNQIWIVYGNDHFQLVTEYMNTDKNIEYKINVEGDEPKQIQYGDGVIPRYNKEGGIEVGNLRAEIDEYIEGVDDERKNNLLEILSLHYLNKVIVMKDSLYSGRQLIDIDKEDNFKQMVKDDVKALTDTDTDIEADGLAESIISMYKKNKEAEKELEALRREEEKEREEREAEQKAEQEQQRQQEQQEQQEQPKPKPIPPTTPRGKSDVSPLGERSKRSGENSPETDIENITEKTISDINKKVNELKTKIDDLGKKVTDGLSDVSNK